MVATPPPSASPGAAWRRLAPTDAAGAAATFALRDGGALCVATFLSPERLAYPPGKAQREKLLARVDALVATSPEVADAAAERFPGDYRLISPGIDLELFRPPAAERPRRIVVEWLPGERPSGRAH